MNDRKPSLVRTFLVAGWTFLLMLIVPFFILLTFNREFPLIVARVFYAPILMQLGGINLEIKGTENINSQTPAIYVANHCSYIDTACLCKALPVNLHFIGKKELIRIPIIGWYMLAVGHIFIDRKNKKNAIKSLKKAVQRIKNGKNVVMYPEGTRSATGEIGDFKRGAFQLALLAEVNIIPISIKGTYETFSKNDRLITPGGKVLIQIGKPITPLNYAANSVKDLASYTKKKIEEMQHLT